MRFLHCDSDPDVVIRNMNNKHVYRLSDIIRLEARSNYTIVYSVDRKPILVAKVLSAYERLLQEASFIRVHRSHLINRKYIHCVDRQGNIVLQDRSKIEIPRRKKKSVSEKLRNSNLIMLPKGQETMTKTC